VNPIDAQALSNLIDNVRKDERRKILKLINNLKPTIKKKEPSVTERAHIDGEINMRTRIYKRISTMKD
jgi:hypothetical protein